MSLHRSNLIERLKLEMEVIYGAARLVNIIILFSLLLLSLALSDNSQTKNGIRCVPPLWNRVSWKNLGVLLAYNTGKSAGDLIGGSMLCLQRRVF